MSKGNKRYPALGILAGFIALLMAASLACASEEPSATPAAPAQPAAPAAPIVAPAVVATLVPGAPTPVPAQPTPTRVLPTATPVVVSQINYGGTLRYTYAGNIDTLDAHHYIQIGAYGPVHIIYSNLVYRQGDDSVGPDIAKSWDFSADGKTITFHLQQGVKFQDGSPLNAQAVQWNFDRISDPEEISPRRAELEPAFDRAEAIDDNTVVLYLNQPFRPLLATLSDRVGWLVSPTAVAKYGEDFGAKPVGSGPFKLKEWRPGQRVILERNDDYWIADKPYMDAIRFDAINDGTVQLAMLRTGEIDIIGINAKDLPLVENNPIVKTVSKDTYSWSGFNINPTIAPFDNRLLRQAIAQAIDRDQIVEFVRFGAGRPAYTPIQGAWANNPDIKPLPYDPQAARQKLASAGYANGITIPLACRSTSSSLQSCEIYQAMLKEVGINAEIKPLPSSDYWGPFGFIKSVGLGPNGFNQRPDPHIIIQWIFHSDGYFNLKRMVNPEVNRLIEDASATYDLAKARQLYSQMAVKVAEDAWWTFHTYSKIYVAMNKRVFNHTVYTDNFPRLRDIWIAQ